MGLVMNIIAWLGFALVMLPALSALGKWSDKFDSDSDTLNSTIDQNNMNEF